MFWDDTFLDRDELVGDESVRLAVHTCCGLSIGRLNQAEDLPGILIEPVLLVVDPLGHRGHSGSRT